MPYVKWLTLTLGLLLLLPGTGLAHPEGHVPARTMEVQAGPYTLTVETGEWPMRAQRWVDLVVIPAGPYDFTNLNMTLRALPGPGVAAKQRSQALNLHPEFPGGRVWGGFISGMAAPGEWVWEFEVRGPQGVGTGRTEPFMVLDPPGVPQWAGWLAALTPLYGLVWFGLRERQRVRKAIQGGFTHA